MEYHDKEWGVPVHDDRLLFEMLTLEGAQAGLSWETVLKKRDGYRKAFHNFNVAKVAAMTDAELESVLTDPGIIRNKLKVYSVRKNALVFISIQKEFGSFDKYIWGFCNGVPIVNQNTSISQVPASTGLSDAISKDLKRRGMSFVGTTIIYAFMQAIGIVDDHLTNCVIKKRHK